MLRCLLIISNIVNVLNNTEVKGLSGRQSLLSCKISINHHPHALVLIGDLPKYTNAPRGNLFFLSTCRNVESKCR